MAQDKQIVNDIQPQSGKQVSETQTQETDQVEEGGKKTTTGGRGITKILAISLITLVVLLASVLILVMTGVLNLGDILDSKHEKEHCEYKGKTYGDKESFASDDGCNTCTCNGSTGTVFCTEMDCESTETENEEEIEETGEKLDDSEKEAEEVIELELPIEVNEEQVYREYDFGDVRYLVYQRTNMNIVFNEIYEESGILYADPNDSVWKSFLRINELGSSKNNVFLLDYDNNEFLALIIDASGAGSGEGIAKLVSFNESLKNVEMLNCFYYIPEHWNLESIDDLKDEVQSYCQGNSEYVQDSSNPNCSNFELVGD